MPTERSFNLTRRLFIFLAPALCLALHFVLFFHEVISENTTQFKNSLLNNSITTAFFMFSSFIAFHLTQLDEEKKGPKYNLAIASIFSIMGIQYLFSALSPYQESALFLQQTSYLLSSICLIPFLSGMLKTEDSKKWFMLLTLFFSMALCTIALAKPRLVADSLSHLWSLVPALIFLFASVKVYLDFKESKSSVHLAFYFYLMANGGISAIHARSELWDQSWWTWNILHFTLGAVSSLAVYFYSLHNFRSSAPSKPEGDLYLYKSYIESLPLAIHCKDYKDKAGTYIDWNKCCEDTWGMNRDSIVGKSHFDIFSETVAKKIQMEDESILASEDALFNEETKIMSPVLGERIVRTWKVSLPDIDGTPRYILTVSQDITDQKKVENFKKEEQGHSIQASKLEMISEMAAGIAHEINNPLTIAHGFLNIIKRDYIKAVPNANANRFQRITEALQRINQIIDGLSKVSTNPEEHKTEIVTVQQIEAGLRDFISFKLNKFDISFMVNKTYYSSLECNPAEIIQVLSNLISNSVDAVCEQKNPWIVLEIDDVGDRIEFRVVDSGNGISEDVREKIFAPFFTTREIGKGTGLGLAIAKGVIEDHGGKIYLDTEHQNTCFVISFPLITGEESLKKAL